MKKKQKNPKIVSQYELLRMLKEGEKGAEEEMRRRMTLVDEQQPRPVKGVRES
ncbi:hypothetical protein [Thermotoga profunda]|uniref:hypothetical protein n=1 Tax=Thermotoga profunda TaxID=1508420 RepID=UPI000A96E2E7|nr:hypothetical protein [Thermotoga profunda]